MGRPTIYTEAMATEICDRLLAGASLRSICGGKPGWDELVDEDNHSHIAELSTVLRWAMDPDHPFHLQYKAAREGQMECWADQLREISEETDEVARARLITDNMKWSASRLLSHRYGDRVKTQIVDANDENVEISAAGQLASLLAHAFAKKQVNESDDDDLV